MIDQRDRLAVVRQQVKQSMTARKISVFLFCLLLASPAWSNVFLRWTQSAVPPATSLGVTELVLPWNPDSLTFALTARKQGYHVYVQATAEQVPQLANAASSSLAGVIVEIPAAQQSQADDTLQKLRSSYPNLRFLLLDPNGKQPQMKGTMVVKRDGILEITSPTAQPWIDSNVPLVRFEQGFRPTQVPLYTFQWELSDPLQQKEGPNAADYSLAIAEAGALHADLILNVPEELQKGLAADDQAAWKLWKQVQPDLAFAAQADQKTVPEGNVGVVTDNYDSAYEPMNLMARHNIPFRVFPLTKLTAQNLHGLKMLLVFTTPGPQAIAEIANFASAGGTAVLVGLKGFYPWHSAAATQVAEHTVKYSVGNGLILELAEPVTDPETFAQDVRRLMSNRDLPMSLWNALTTIGLPYRNAASGTSVLELVNYSGDPLRVQLKLKGRFHSIRYKSPDRACCQSLTPAQRDGFTEFVIPSLRTSGRVHLAGPFK
jgi:hypothetical protein